MIKPFHNPRSTFSRRARIALQEKHIPFETATIDMDGRECLLARPGAQATIPAR